MYMWVNLNVCHASIHKACVYISIHIYIYIWVNLKVACEALEYGISLSI